MYRRGRMYDHGIYNFLSLWLGAAGFGKGAEAGAHKTMTWSLEFGDCGGPRSFGISLDGEPVFVCLILRMPR